VAVVTGTRAEYGILASILRAMEQHSRLELQLVVTGMHLLRPFGYTVRQIEQDGWPIAVRVPMQRGDDDPLDQAIGLARGVVGIARYLEAAASDAVVVLGDRIEALAGALAAVSTGRLLAHIHGGDVAPGDFDDSMRHAITKLAHVHFAATRDAGQRIVRLGEAPQRVHVVGGPGLDRLRELVAEADGVPRATRRSAATSGRAAVVVYHAWGRPAALERRTMSAVLDAVTALGLRRVICYPNTDRGHQGVLAAIEAHRRKSPAADVQIHKSLARDEYLRTLMSADVLVGNSSSGIIEAPFAGTPSVDVGGREAGRQAGGRGVLHTDESVPAIRQAVAAALRLRIKPGGRTVYGDGHAGARIARLLATMPLTWECRRKVITY
jgi:UDP-hydrolysing UDP-N-acetyl-D-glucosamine 2-epimerase